MLNVDQTGTRKPLRWLSPIIWLLDAVMFALFDWKWIFPLKDHPDFGFQLAFELGCVTASALTTMAWVMLMTNPATHITFQQRPRWIRGFVNGFLWGVPMFLLSGVGSLRVHRFEGWSLFGDLLLWLIGGWGWGFAMSGRGNSAGAVAS